MLTSAPAPVSPTVNVVIVSWHHERWLRACISAIASAGQNGFTLGSVVVVDNAAALPMDSLGTGATSVTVIRNEENRGFARACNQGAARCSGDYLLFLNPDTIVRPDALSRAIAALQTPSNADVAIVGLRIVDTKQVTQRTCGRFPNLRALAAQTLGLSRLTVARFPGIRMTDWPHDSTRDVDFVCGAALLVHRYVFEILGGFDERLFLYLEDADLALRARERGWRTRFCDTAVVEHASGWSQGTHRSWRLAHSWRSLLVYGWTHLGALRALALAALVFSLAPIARIGEALSVRSASPVTDAGRALLQLIGLLRQDLLDGHSAEESRVTPGAAVRAAGAESLRQE